MDDALKITVEGHPGQGASTVALVIEKTLKDRDFTVVRRDPDHPGQPEPGLFKRLEEVRASLVVVEIEVAQAARCPISRERSPERDTLDAIRGAVSRVRKRVKPGSDQLIPEEAINLISDILNGDLH